MNALLYGIVPLQCSRLHSAGIGGAPVLFREYRHFCIFFSAVHEARTYVPDDVLTFHRLLAEVLAMGDLVPFRFPTVVPVDELNRRLEGYADHFAAALHAIAGTVQMDLELLQEEGSIQASSGRNYLWAKAVAARRPQALAVFARDVLAPFVKSIDITTKGKRILVHLLVPRELLPQFMVQARQAYPKARITGPWPPAAFVSGNLP